MIQASRRAAGPTRTRPNLPLLCVLATLIAVAARPSPALPGEERPQIVRGGGVAVILSRLSSEGDTLRFRIEMTTHMRDLDVYRFEEIARLRDATGKEPPPLAVERVMGGGHHRSAVLRFPTLGREVSAVEVVVRDVAGIPERVFRWDLHGQEPPGRIPPNRPPRVK